MIRKEMKITCMMKMWSNHFPALSPLTEATMNNANTAPRISGSWKITGFMNILMKLIHEDDETRGEDEIRQQDEAGT